MSINTSITVIHVDYDHPLGMPCRECRIDEGKGKKPITKKRKDEQG